MIDGLPIHPFAGESLFDSPLAAQNRVRELSLRVLNDTPIIPGLLGFALDGHRHAPTASITKLLLPQFLGLTDLELEAAENIFSPHMSEALLDATVALGLTRLNNRLFISEKNGSLNFLDQTIQPDIVYLFRLPESIDHLGLTVDVSVDPIDYGLKREMAIVLATLHNCIDLSINDHNELVLKADGAKLHEKKREVSKSNTLTPAELKEIKPRLDKPVFRVKISSTSSNQPALNHVFKLTVAA